MKLLNDYEYGGKAVICRVGFNVDLVEGKILDDTRIVSTLPTLQYVLDHGAQKIGLVTHLGRPEGKYDAQHVLEPVAKRLAELFNSSFLKLSNGYKITEKIFLYENIRFDRRETSKDSKERKELAKELAEGFDIYINDAFADCHRKHASLYELAELLPNAAGLLVQKETEMLSKLLENPSSPFVCVMGGAKVDTKIGVIGNLLDKADKFLIGGKIGNAFLTALGKDMKDSRADEAETAIAKTILEKSGHKIELPTDFNWSGSQVYDIGPESANNFCDIIKKAETVFWNGPLGYIEGDEKFIEGSRKVAEAMSQINGTTIISGGETVAVAQKLDLADKVTFFSTGGGATLEFLAGIKLPGLEALGYYNK